MHRRIFLRGSLGLYAAAMTWRNAVAQSETQYPNRTVRIILPFTPGGAIDQMSRVAAEMLGRELHQSFVIESKPGAGGVIGTTSVVRSSPDGYTLVAASASAITIAPFMHATLPYNPEVDLQPIVMLGDSPIAVIVRRESPYMTLEELITAAKAHAGKLSFGSAGHGTAAHLGGELFKWRASVNLLHVPYRGVSPAIVDLLAGRTDVMFVNYSVVDSQVQTGKLRVLAIASKKRMAGRPEFPTAAELGLSDYIAGNWNGLMAPAGTPRMIVDKLNQVVVNGFHDPALRARMAQMGMDPVTGTPEQFAEHIKREVTQMKALIAASGIMPE